MKNVKFLIVLSLVALVLTFYGSVDAQEAIVEHSGSTGFKPVDNQTITVTTTSAVIIGTLPPSCKTIEVVAVSADINYGASDVGTGTSWPYIPHGESKIVTEDNSTRKPTIYFRIRGTATESSSLGIVAK